MLELFIFFAVIAFSVVGFILIETWENIHDVDIPENNHDSEDTENP